MRHAIFTVTKLAVVAALGTLALTAKPLFNAAAGWPSPDIRASAALATRDLTALQAALDDGASIEGRTSTGVTFLMDAAGANDVELMQWLLRRRANINACDTFGSSVLMYAASNDAAEAIELLMQRGADPAQRNRLGQTAADLAQNINSVHAAEVLRKYRDPTAP